MRKAISILVAVALLAITAFGFSATAVEGCDATGLISCENYGGDTDDDGVCDDLEDNFYGTDKYDADTDDGGACDGDEVFLDSTDPTNPTDDLG